MKKIAIDVDDVLAAFTPSAYQWMGKSIPYSVNYWDVPTMDKELGKGWFTDILQHEEEFWKTLERLSHPSTIDFEVSCYMSAFPTKMFHTRHQWLIDEGFPDAPLIIVNDKLKACRQLGMDVLIDDKPQTIEKFQGTEIRGIHFMTPYAGFEPVGEYITSLKQVKELLNESKSKVYHT